MHSGADDPQSGPGFPIRRSQDQGSVTSSSGLIAGSHVLHRLSTPRHPPCALGHLIAPTRSRHPAAGAIPAEEPARRRAPTPFRRAQALCSEHYDLFCSRCCRHATTAGGDWPRGTQRRNFPFMTCQRAASRQNRDPAGPGRRSDIRPAQTSIVGYSSLGPCQLDRPPFLTIFTSGVIGETTDAIRPASPRGPGWGCRAVPYVICLGTIRVPLRAPSP